MIDHHADFAAPITHRLWLETTVPRRSGSGQIAGWGIALGWWVDPGQSGEPAGTLYLIVDSEDTGPPAWVREGHVLRTELRAMRQP